MQIRVEVRKIAAAGACQSEMGGRPRMRRTERRDEKGREGKEKAEDEGERTADDVGERADRLAFNEVVL